MFGSSKRPRACRQFAVFLGLAKRPNARRMDSPWTKKGCYSRNSHHKEKSRVIYLTYRIARKSIYAIKIASMQDRENIYANVFSYRKGLIVLAFR